MSPQINDFSWAMVREKEVSWGFKNCPLLLFLPRCIYYGERRPLLAGWIGFQDGGVGWGVLGQWWDGDGLLRWQFWQLFSLPSFIFFSFLASFQELPPPSSFLPIPNSVNRSSQKKPPPTATATTSNPAPPSSGFNFHFFFSGEIVSLPFPSLSCRGEGRERANFS